MCHNRLGLVIKAGKNQKKERKEEAEEREEEEEAEAKKKKHALPNSSAISQQIFWNKVCDIEIGEKFVLGVEKFQAPNFSGFCDNGDRDREIVVWRFEAAAGIQAATMVETCIAYIPTKGNGCLESRWATFCQCT